MSFTKLIAKHLREVYFGGNWTWVNMKETLNGVTWEQALAKVSSFNTIAVLVNHIHYYVVMQLKVLRGGPLEGHDSLSFEHPPINSQKDWDAMLAKVWTDAEDLAVLIEQLPDERMFDTFADIEKYGNYYRNLAGMIEHTHYHLGQISLIKKVLHGGQLAV